MAESIQTYNLNVSVPDMDTSMALQTNSEMLVIEFIHRIHERINVEVMTKKLQQQSQKSDADLDSLCGLYLTGQSVWCDEGEKMKKYNLKNNVSVKFVKIYNCIYEGLC